MLPGSNNTRRLNFEDNPSRAEEFNQFFANVGKIAYEKSRLNAIEDEDEERNVTNFNLAFQNLNRNLLMLKQ